MAIARTERRPFRVSVSGGGCRPLASVRGRSGAHARPYGSTPASKFLCISRLIRLATAGAIWLGTVASSASALENPFAVNLAKAVASRRAAVRARLVIPVHDRVTGHKRTGFVDSGGSGGVHAIFQF